MVVKITWVTQREGEQAIIHVDAVRNTVFLESWRAVIEMPYTISALAYIDVSEEGEMQVIKTYLK